MLARARLVLLGSHRALLATSRALRLGPLPLAID